MIKIIDEKIINFLNKIWRPLARISLFIVFFYFGFLKVLGLSPATPLVDALFQKTLDFFSFSYFIIFFGLFEMIIGLAFIIPRLERLAIFLLIIHMVTTFLSLILLPQITWHKFLVPTLEGQYIIKNLVIISLAFVIGAHLTKKD
ncbi:MAG: hypothetical protein KatS3mg095_0426 [Candidatus Parcubacteria bacterium]|nr:MAG: hypothetical protein KatS3mg095_0426 [Candidatus Parcubacteria bacterium]